MAYLSPVSGSLAEKRLVVFDVDAVPARMTERSGLEAGEVRWSDNDRLLLLPTGSLSTTAYVLDGSLTEIFRGDAWPNFGADVADGDVFGASRDYLTRETRLLRASVLGGPVTVLRTLEDAEVLNVVALSNPPEFAPSSPPVAPPIGEGISLASPRPSLEPPLGTPATTSPSRSSSDGSGGSPDPRWLFAVGAGLGGVFAWLGRRILSLRRRAP